jgi:16S rRNA (guanine527-N7)-methyltransferase
MLGVRLSADHLDALGLYLEELLLWGRRVNLIGLRSRERICVELLADSLAPVPWIPQKGALLDVGSGAGLPGIPIKIVRPHLEVVLLEPSAKKQSFLRHVVRVLGLQGIRTIRGRAERPDQEIETGAYEVVTARAVAGLGEVVGLCSAYVAEGGLLIGFLGGNAQRELESASGVLEGTALTLEASMPYLLPGKKGERHVVRFRKRALS